MTGDVRAELIGQLNGCIEPDLFLIVLVNMDEDIEQGMGWCGPEVHPVCSTPFWRNVLVGQDDVMSRVVGHRPAPGRWCNQMTVTAEPEY
ncbi:hypothetical protein [Sphingomonas oryzagri]